MAMANPHFQSGNTSSFMVDFPANHVSFRGGVLILELGFFGDDLRRLHMRMAVLEGFG